MRAQRPAMTNSFQFLSFSSDGYPFSQNCLNAVERHQGMSPLLGTRLTDWQPVTMPTHFGSLAEYSEGMNKLLLIASVCLAASLAGCQTAPTKSATTAAAVKTVTLPLVPAWFEGRQVDCVTTDVSDAGFAKLLGINHAPRLALALPPEGSPPTARSSAEKVYLFPNGEQANVFPSVPTPTGAASTDVNYSPLWVVILAEWKPGSKVVTLTSEEAVLEAQERGDLVLKPTRVVANTAVVRDPKYGALKGVL
jgi:hypothetical protein